MATIEPLLWSHFISMRQRRCRHRAPIHPQHIPPSNFRNKKGEFEMRMKDALFFRFRLLPIIVLVLLIPAISHAQATIKVNDNISLRFGTLIQAWADSAQDATTKGYAENLFMRRMRILIGGTLSPTVSFFFETDNPNLGKAPKNLGGGFITQDAFVEWKPRSSAFILDAGLMLPPLCRNCLESAATLLSLDYGSWSFVESAATQSSVGRDTGFQAKGYLAGTESTMACPPGNCGSAGAITSLWPPGP
jgi:hypothetical protein